MSNPTTRALLCRAVNAVIGVVTAATPQWSVRIDHDKHEVAVMVIAGVVKIGLCDDYDPELIGAADAVTDALLHRVLDCACDLVANKTLVANVGRAEATLLDGAALPPLAYARGTND